MPTPEEAVRAYCAAFNRGCFHEAHDFLEVLWLPLRRTAEGELWKGLIQLAAAFVHVQRGRRGPALVLLRTARDRITRFGAGGCPVDLAGAVAVANEWEALIQAKPEVELPFILRDDPPRLTEAVGS